MAASMFRRGQRELWTCGVASATVIARGDMLEKSSSDEDVLNAAGFTWDTDEITTQANFANTFIGIAYEASANGETDDISVDVSADSVYEFDVISGTYNPGESLGPDSASSLLQDQVLTKAVSTSAIARSVEEAATAVTRLEVKFASAWNPSANNLNSVVG